MIRMISWSARQDDVQDDRLVSGAPCLVGSGAPSRMVAALWDDGQDDRLVSGALCLVGRGAPSRMVATLQDDGQDDRLVSGAPAKTVDVIRCFTR